MGKKIYFSFLEDSTISIANFYLLFNLYSKPSIFFLIGAASYFYKLKTYFYLPLFSAIAHRYEYTISVKFPIVSYPDAHYNSYIYYCQLYEHFSFGQNVRYFLLRKFYFMYILRYNFKKRCILNLHNTINFYNLIKYLNYIDDFIIKEYFICSIFFFSDITCNFFNLYETFEFDESNSLGSEV